MTILIVSPDDHTEVSSVDGHAQQSADAVWATIRTAAGDGVADGDAAAQVQCQIVTHASSSGVWSDFTRGIYVFDTGKSLPHNAEISSAIIEFAGAGNVVDGFGSAAISLVLPSPASNTAIVAGDYNSFAGLNGSMTKQANDIALASLNDNSSYETEKFTLDATGLSNISKTVPSAFGIVITFDAENAEPAWVGDTRSRVQIVSADGGPAIPKMTIEYTVAHQRGPSGGVGLFSSGVAVV
jgi:hypothetical protein|tara:strand:- start:179 stop:898 length:720 start_codon:yes stop_codon:yes gene_type:complete